MPRSIANVLLIIFTAALARTWFYVHGLLAVDVPELLGLLATGPLALFVWRFLPGTAKDWAEKQGRRILLQQGTTRVLAVIAGALLLLGTIVSSARVVWTGKDSIPLRVDRTASQIGGDSNSLHVFRISGTKLEVSVGAFSQTCRIRPWDSCEIVIPEESILMTSTRVIEVENDVILALLRHDAELYLARSRDLLKELPATNASEKASAERLGLINKIVALSMHGADLEDDAGQLLDRMHSRFPTDPFLPVLEGLHEATKKQYPSARQAINAGANGDASRVELLAIKHALSGFWAFRQAYEGAARGGVVDRQVLELARGQFQLAITDLERSTAKNFAAIAVNAVRLLSGVVDFYVGNLAAAKATFELISKAAPTKSMQARGRSNMGFVEFALGNLAEAQSAFDDAIVMDPLNSRARINRAYIELAYGNYKSARTHLLNIVSDDAVKLRDVHQWRLASLGAAHALDTLPNEAAAVDEYARCAQAFELSDFAHVDVPMARLANLQLELGHRVYTEAASYGLELFALTLFAKAYETSLAMENSGYPSQVLQAREIRTRAVDLFRHYEHAVQPFWKSNPPENGFFAPLRTLSRALADRSPALQQSAP